MALINGTVTDSATPSEAASTEKIFYQYNPIDKAKRAFRLLVLRGGTGHDIDCEIVESTIDSNTLPYEAVSYTWGPSFTADTVNIYGKKLPVTFNLSFILRDLRFADADRVIWVDAICIDQQDATEKGHQVGQMQDIFALAERVLFCISRPTNYTDLFLSSLERIQSEIQHIDLSDDSAIDACWNRTQTAIARHHLMSSAEPSENLLLVQLEAMTFLQRQGLEWILGQPWFHRVWILQEVANARDALVYCGQKSVSAAIFALGARLLGYSLPDKQRETVDEVLNLMPGLVRRGPSQDLLSLFRRFGKANASVERDRIYALFGMCNDKQIQTHISPNYTKSEQEVIIDTVAYIFHLEVSVIATSPYDLIAHFLSDLDLLGNTMLSHFLSWKNHKGALSILQHHGNSISVTPDMLDMAINDTMMEEGVMSELLKQRNADTLLSGREGWKPLCFAAEHGYDTLVRQMLEKGALIEAQGSEEFNGEKKTWTPLSLAVMNGHETVVKMLLEKGADLEGTPLAWATRNGHCSSVHLLVEKGSMIRNYMADDQSLEGRTPLSWAASKGYEAIVRLLLKHGADPMRRDWNQNDTPLSTAAENGHRFIVQVLLENCAKVDRSCVEHALTCAARAAQISIVSLLLDVETSTDLLGALSAAVEKTWEGDNKREDFEAIVMMLLTRGAHFGESSNPLVTAAIAGNERMVRLFLDHGAKVDYVGTRHLTHCPYHYSGTALAFAIRYGHKDVAEVLLAEGAPIEARDSCKQTPLLMAARSCHENIVKMLLQKGADVEARDRDGRLPINGISHSLTKAVQHWNIVKLLLESMSDAVVRECSGEPLLWAAEDGRGDMVKILLAKGAPIDPKNPIGNTPLAFAANNGHVDIVTVLLENGADIEVRDSRDRTPLHLAASSGHKNTIKVLLKNGADIQVRDSFRQTPLSLAAESGHKNTVNVLLENGAGIKVRDSRDRTPLHLAALHGNESTVIVLLENGADIEVKDSFFGRTPLHLATYFDYENTTKVLLENGADIEVRDSCGRTPLHLAAEYGCETTVRELLDNGADIESRDMDNRTALLFAAAEGHKNVVKALIENGADIEAKDRWECTPLIMALNEDQKDVTTLLLESGANSNVDMKLYNTDNYVRVAR